MSALLVNLAFRLIVGILMTIGIYFLASTIHERSHWLVGRIWSNDLHIIGKFGLFPASVDFGSPYDIPPYGIRLAGIAPFLVGAPVSAVLFLYLDYSFPLELLLTVPFWAAAILSPIDFLAFLYPERFQEIASENESISHIETIGLIVREFRSNGLAAEDITNG